MGLQSDGKSRLCVSSGSVGNRVFVRCGQRELLCEPLPLSFTFATFELLAVDRIVFLADLPGSR